MNIQIKNVVLVVATLLSAGVLSAPAFAADAMLSTGGYAREFSKMGMMKMLDADGNHMVTAAEADTYYNSIFEELDKDKDGSVDAKEWAGPAKHSKLDLATGGYSRELRSMKMMGMMDADSDHKVTRAEFLAYHQTIFAHKDTSGDKEITAQEWAAKLL
ncbi:calcium-binding protein [Methylotenera sp.]|uniref:calcium-binding protein n=1 Tax=Methylotenera sp. TaxID=2051956 RepID=UPI0024895CB0|nr:calcium-binding protein [Methylotenera sp.]MDI1361881.1 calcium-binding protein [Methylotenera sp.]